MPPTPIDSDWHLQAWMRHFGKRQASLVSELGWLKGRASKVWNGVIGYRREIVVELADWLKIRPYELLMPPEEALALRNIRESAQTIADVERRLDDERIATTAAPERSRG